ncbi:MAG TPA: DUF1501 domain-containing protein [Pirellulaceae bacterium]|nr:DUF1501 domain-containing protein [Pirellulaceae bacterium]
MAFSLTCDGVKRRDFLKAGALGMGLSLSGYLRLAAAGEIGPAKAKSAIFINLTGGPSHMDSFDLKPDAPAEYRGQFNPIKTNAPGVEISEHLPNLAKCADKFAILRGVSHTLGAHELGTEYVNTGSRPIPSLEYPGYGAVVTKELGGPKDLPPFVAIPNSNQRPGFLGVQYAPLNTTSAPRPGVPYGVRGITLGNGLTVEEVERRTNLLADLDKTFASVESNSQLLTGLDRFSEQAHAIITSKKARDAFDVSKETPAYAKPFGEDPFGMSCLLASRLVESGVRFVTLTLGGWDTHNSNFTRLKTNLLPKLDVGLAALLNGLAEKGLLDSTSVFVTGEFGRTPKINSRDAEGGRDHYPRCMFMVLAGGGVRGGQVLGESDDKATMPKNEGFSPDDVAATFYHTLGIDHTKEYQTNSGRPITIVRDGKVIRGLFS